MAYRTGGHGAIALAVAASAILLMLASGPSAWATPPQEPGRQTIPRPDRGGGTGAISPDRGGTATSLPGDVSITVPAGAVSSDTTLHLVPRDASIAPLATGSPLIGQAFTAEAWQGLQAKPGFTFARAISVCIKYTDADLGQVLGPDKSERLVVQRYDEATKKWLSLPTVVDFERRKACASATSVGWFALSTRAPGVDSPQGTEAGLPSTASAPGAISARIDPQTGGKLTVGEGIVIEVPSGGVAEPVDLLYSLETQGRAAAAAEKLTLVKPAFSVDAYRDSRVLSGFAFAKPVQLCISFTDQELAAVGGDPRRLEVKRFDSTAGDGKGSWVSVPTRVDNTNRRVCAAVQYLSSFALTSSVPAVVYGDALAEPRLILPIIVVALVLVGGGLFVLLRSRGTSEEPPQEG
ncbi:MAG: hypothetical protein HYX92_12010 [Chloroflexi bacterium]|nr:hypothetical protein [Chloroflexota bacterium]